MSVGRVAVPVGCAPRRYRGAALQPERAPLKSAISHPSIGLRAFMRARSSRIARAALAALATAAARSAPRRHGASCEQRLEVGHEALAVDLPVPGDDSGVVDDECMRHDVRAELLQLRGRRRRCGGWRWILVRAVVGGGVWASART